MIHDVTVLLRPGMPTWPGDPGIEIGNWNSIANGDSENVSVLKFGAHTGTHIDAPVHCAKGKWSTDEIPLQQLLGEAIVIDVSANVNNNADYQITIADVEAWEKQNGKIPRQLAVRRMAQ